MLSSEDVFYIVTLVLATTHSFVAVFFFIRRRSKFPIAGRNMHLVIFSTVAFSVRFSVVPIQGLVDLQLPCSALFVGRFFILVVPVVFFLRSYRIWFEYTLHGELQGHKWATSWFLRHRRRVNTPNMIKAAVLITSILYSIITTAYVVNIQRVPNVEPTCEAMEIVFRIGTGFGVLGAITGFFVVYKLRNIRDNFGIKRELFALAVAFVIATVVGNTVRTRLPQSGLVAIFFPISIIGTIVQVTEPVIKSYIYEARAERERVYLHNSKKRAMSTSKEVTTLASVYADDELYMEFVKHMQSEFAVENVMFYKAADSFHQKASRNGYETVKAKNGAALKLFLDFVATGAYLQVNIDSSMRVGIQNKMEIAFGAKKIRTLVEDIARQNWGTDSVFGGESDIDSDDAASIDGGGFVNSKVAHYIDADASIANIDSVSRSPGDATSGSGFEAEVKIDIDQDRDVLSSASKGVELTNLEYPQEIASHRQSRTKGNLADRTRDEMSKLKPHSSRSRLDRHTEEVPSDIFEPAKNAIFKLMEFDNFVRFCEKTNRLADTGRHSASLPSVASTSLIATSKTTDAQTL